jgi:hypothetical protein
MENIKGEGRLETNILGTLQLDHYIRGMLVFTENLRTKIQYTKYCDMSGFPW